MPNAFSPAFEAPACAWPFAAHVAPALPGSGSAVNPAESEPFGKRCAEPEVLGLSMAHHAVEEIGRRCIVVELKAIPDERKSPARQNDSQVEIFQSRKDFLSRSSAFIK